MDESTDDEERTNQPEKAKDFDCFKAGRQEVAAA
jgi:hypothetical protein